MSSELDLCLKTYKEEFGIDTNGKDIDEILGISDLNLKPYVWKPYSQVIEEFLQTKLKECLLDKQKEFTDGFIIGEYIFREYQGSYILVTPVKKQTKKTNKDGVLKYFSHLLITIYNGENNYLHHTERSLLKVAQAHGKFFYNKIKIAKNQFYQPVREKLEKMGLFLIDGRVQQQIYTSRLLPAINYINNELVLNTNLQGHHVMFDTQQELESRFSMLLLDKNKHSEIFHPDNTRGSNNSVINQAKGILYSEMLRIKYFKTKERKFNTNIHTNLVNVLEEYFINHLSITQIRNRIKEVNPNNTLTYNTIDKIVTHFKQYNLVLTPQNIDHIRLL